VVSLEIAEGAENPRNCLAAEDWCGFPAAHFGSHRSTMNRRKGRPSRHRWRWKGAAMSSQFQPQQFDCDAPDYCIVKACQELGFHSPLDVRWCRMGHLLGRHGIGSGLLGWLFGRSRPSEKRCACGQPLPRLERHLFAFDSGRRATYLLGQCGRCHRIYWEEPH